MNKINSFFSLSENSCNHFELLETPILQAFLFGSEVKFVFNIQLDSESIKLLCFK